MQGGSVPQTENEKLAAEELERFRALQLYADRKLIHQGQYVAAARQIATRTRRGSWVGLLAGAFMAWDMVSDLMHPHASAGRGEALIDAAVPWIAGLWLLIFAAIVVGAVLARARTKELVRRVESLLPETPAGEPAAGNV
jgi:hypothetical protein